MSRRDDVQLPPGVEPLLDKDQLALYLNWTTRWIDEKIHEGLPWHLVGCYKRFDRAEVLEWLASRGETGDRDAA